MIRALFEIVNQKEIEDVNSSYKIQVQFLEIYGEDIKDLLDHTKTSKVSIREINGEVFVSGAREENVSSAAQMMKTLEVGTQHRTTASTMMNQESSRSHGTIKIATNSLFLDKNYCVKQYLQSFWSTQFT